VISPYLEITGLKKSYGLKPVLRGVNLTLEAGQRMALLGANGAGKTTLLRILAGLTKPGAGKVRIGRLDLAHDAQQARLQVGFVSHTPYLYEELTALENLIFFGRMYAITAVKERAQFMLERVGLAKKANERANALSRGQAQRLSLARALLHSPRLLLLDEPDSGLDEAGIVLLEELLDEHLGCGGTTLFTTHNLERAAHMSDCIALLSRGRVVYTQASSVLEAGSMSEVYRKYLEAVP